MGTIEIVDAQEHSDATGKLLAHNACLLVAVGTRQQNACLSSIGTNHDPTLLATIIGERRCVFRQLELQDVNEETDSRAEASIRQAGCGSLTFAFALNVSFFDTPVDLPMGIAAQKVTLTCASDHRGLAMAAMTKHIHRACQRLSLRVFTWSEERVASGVAR